jgi:hypothetical protein
MPGISAGCSRVCCWLVLVSNNKKVNLRKIKKMQLDKDELRDYEQRAFFEKKEVSETNPLNIFFAVLAAILVSGLSESFILNGKSKGRLPSSMKRCRL